jgi:hypothetical protein
MSRHIALTVVYEEVEGGWTQATIAEMPAVITAAPSRATAKTLIVDALHEYLRSLEQEAAPLGPDADSEPVELRINA